jgi:hypothetical protein
LPSTSKVCNENNDRLDQKLNEIKTDINNTTDFALNRDKLIAVQSEIKLLKLRKEQRHELLPRQGKPLTSLTATQRPPGSIFYKEKNTNAEFHQGKPRNKIARLEDSIEWDRRSLDYQKDKLGKFEPGENPDPVREVSEIVDSIEARIADKEKNIEESGSGLVTFKRT